MNAIWATIGQVGRDGADGLDGEPELAEVREGLGDEPVHPALEQRLRLLPEGGGRLRLAERSERQEVLPERADGAEDEHVPAHRLADVARQPDARPVDVADPPLEPVHGELEAVGAERVRLEQVGARGDVLHVDRLDGLRVLEVQDVEAGVERDAPGVQHRAHGAVGEERPFLEAAAEGPGARRR